MNRVPLAICAALAIFAAATVAIIEFSGNANAGGGMDSMHLDLDTAGNTATTIGTVENCKRINENDIQDADETGVDTLTMDLLAVGIPTGTNAMIGFSATLLYNETALTIQTIDVALMLLASPGSSLLNTSDIAPDTDGNGSFTAAALDVGSPGSEESGSGTLARMTISSDAGAAANQYNVTFDDVNTVHIDTMSNAFQPASNPTPVTIAINEPCGGGATDTPTPSPSPTPLPSGVTAAPTPTPSPTPTPCLECTPTATPEPTPTPTDTPPPTPTPTPCKGPECPTITPTPVVTPTPTPTEGPALLKGDLQCDGDVDSVDALMALRHIADLSVNQTQPCPEIGSSLARQIAGAGSDIFGDINCNGSVEAVDPLFILRHIAALSVNLPTGCAPIGE